MSSEKALSKEWATPVNRVEAYHRTLIAYKNMAQSVLRASNVAEVEVNLAWEIIEEVMQGLIDVFLYMFDNEENTKNTPTVDAVSWKDFRDFLDDNAEDFESINKRLDALTKQVSDLIPPIKSNVPVMLNGTWYNPNVLKGGHYTVSDKTEEVDNK